MIEKKILGIAPFLTSSQDVEKISTTIKGVCLALIPLAVVILNSFEINATAELLQELNNAVFVVVGGIMAVIGIIAKFKK